MEKYKRNQLEEAISRLFGEKSAEPSSGVRTRMKRLLDLDRGLPWNSRSNKPELANCAFYSGSSPGKGIEVLFSDYEAFALVTALKMLNHNWPQKFVVETLRRYRRELEGRHRNILSQDPDKLFDEEQIKATARPGGLAANSTSPMFFLIWSDDRYSRDSAAVAQSAKIFDDENTALKFTLEKAGRSSTWLELTRSAHALATELSKTLPRKRGRG
jgi:hypothetical protein